MPVHKPDELARFQSGESRMVWAAHVDDPEQRVFFPEVTPHEQRSAFRELTRKSLCCVVPDCRLPLTAHFREGKRDGFVHPKGSKGHSPESLWHHEAKARIAEWAATTYTGMQVQVEQATDDRKRRPDVTITGTTGHQVAIEIQYAALTVDQWRERQRDLARGGRAVVWLLGHAGQHFKVDPAGRVKYSELVRSMAAEDCIALWFNPIEDLILTTWSKSDEHGITPPAGRFAFGHRVTPLEECWLTSDGIMTEHLEQLRAAANTRAALRALALELEEQRRRESEVRRERELAASRRLLAARRDRWTHSDLYLQLTTAGPMPDIITAPPTAEDVALADALDLYPSHWKAVIYEILLSGGGASVSNVDVLRALTRAARGRRVPNFDAFNLFMAALVDADLIRAKVGSGPTSRLVFEAVCWQPAVPKPGEEAMVPVVARGAEESFQADEGADEEVGEELSPLDRMTRVSTPAQFEPGGRSPVAAPLTVPRSNAAFRKPGPWRRLLSLLGFTAE